MSAARRSISTWCGSVCAMLLLSACASPGLEAPSISGEQAPADEVATAISSSDKICRNERPTGTHIVQRVCYTRAELEAQSEASKEWLRSGGTKGGPQRVLDPADPRDE